jgi:GNAT superfamily N-acetyltransferase
MNIQNCTAVDFNEIVKDIIDFWGSERTLHLHQPYLIHEFGNTAFVIKDEGRVVAYLFGFFSQTEDLAYVHLIGVRESYQRKGLGKMLYNNYLDIARTRGIHKVKAITSPANIKSINFHTKKIGMTMTGEPDENGINVIKNYSGPNNHRAVFIKQF